jgi:leucyl-tRNA synthetase
MGVPAHDTRDAGLAEVRGLPSVNVIAKTSKDDDGDASSDGIMVNSGPFDGMNPVEARKAISAELKVNAAMFFATFVHVDTFFSVTRRG